MKPDPGSIVPRSTDRPPPAGAVGGAVPARPTSSRKRLALALAIAVDFVQIVAMPVFAAGVASPWNNVLDVVTAIVMIRLLGWHLAFLPTFVTELVPFVGLFPTWTAAVFFVSRRR
jgi:hypothetical protein